MLAGQVVAACERLARGRPSDRPALEAQRRRALEHLVDYVVTPDPDFDKERQAVKLAVRRKEEQRQADEALLRVSA